MNEEIKYHSINTVAEKLGVGHQCVRYWINTGKLEAIRIGKRILVAQSALDNLISKAQKGSDTTEEK
jgi:excisionase family DNA binding protein